MVLVVVSVLNLLVVLLNHVIEKKDLKKLKRNTETSIREKYETKKNKTSKLTKDSDSDSSHSDSV